MIRIIVLVLFGTICSIKSRAQNSTVVKVSVMYSKAPVLKRLLYNPIMRIRIYVPTGKEINCNSINLSMDEETLKSLETVDVLVRDDREPAFIPNATLLASIKPASIHLDLPIKMNCTSGLNYVWVNAVLKKDANIDKRLKITATGITAVNGNKYPMSEISSPSGSDKDVTYRMGVAVRKAGDDSVNTYRIPGIVATDKGTLIAVYDIRYNSSRDLPGNIDIGMSRSTDRGRTWQPMKIIMDMGDPPENNGVGDPSILFDPFTKKLWVSGLWSKGNRSIAGSEPGLSPDSSGQFVLVSSDDDGQTWSKLYNITSQVKNPAWHIYFQGPGNGIAMQNGTLVFPSQYWDETRKPGMSHSSIIYSYDHGKTWKSGIGAKSNTTESAVVETTPGRLMLNMRDNRGSYRSISTTIDMGNSWTEHPTSQETLPDPVCMASLIKARVNVKGKMKDVLFFSNAASQNSRQNTTIKASLDLGESWIPSNQLLIDSRKSFGYSSLTKIDDNTIGLLYEGERDLYFLRVPVNEIIK